MQPLAVAEYLPETLRLVGDRQQLSKLSRVVNSLDIPQHQVDDQVHVAPLGQDHEPPGEPGHPGPGNDAQDGVDVLGFANVLKQIVLDFPVRRMPHTGHPAERRESFIAELRLQQDFHLTDQDVERGVLARKFLHIFRLSIVPQESPVGVGVSHKDAHDFSHDLLSHF